MPLKKKTLFTTSPSGDRERKNLLFLNLIKERKSSSRTEISKLTDINVVTVSNYVNSYLKKGLALERGYDVSSGGRRPELVELNKEWGYAAGIDIGDDYVKATLSDLNLKALAGESVTGYEKKNLKSVVSGLLQKLLSAAKIDKSRVKKIGVGLSKKSDSFKEDAIRIKDDIEEELGIPVIVGKEVSCAAFGEKSLNPEAKETANILYIHKDVGYAIFIKDEEFYEANKEKNENAYLEAWAEGLSVVSMAKSIVKQGIGTKVVDMALGDVEKITLEIVIKAAEQKDELAIDLLKSSGTNLGVRVSYLINLFEPDLVIIGGGPEKAGALFLDAVQKGVKKFILQKMMDKVKLSPAVLGEDACVKGSALLAIREAFIEA